MVDPRATFHTYGLRCTKQREILYAALCATKAHPTAEDLFQAVRHEDPGLSLATVYNTLEAFTRCGLVRRLATDGAARYDADLTPHVHVVHGDGRVADVPAEVGRMILGRLRAEDLRAIESATGVSIDHVSVQVRAKASGVGELV